MLVARQTYRDPYTHRSGSIEDASANHAIAGPGLCHIRCRACITWNNIYIHAHISNRQGRICRYWRNKRDVFLHPLRFETGYQILNINQCVLGGALFLLAMICYHDRTLFDCISGRLKELKSSMWALVITYWNTSPNTLRSIPQQQRGVRLASRLSVWRGSATRELWSLLGRVLFNLLYIDQHTRRGRQHRHTVQTRVTDLRFAAGVIVLDY